MTIMMTELKHPRALAIARKGETCLWEMGDYLLEVCGKPRTEYHDGSQTKITEVAKELEENGYPQYSTTYLAQLRMVAHNFSISDRVRDISWTTHHIAASPNVLQAVIAAAKAEGRKGVSKRFVMNVMNGMEADRKVKRKHVARKAEAVAEKAEADRAKAEADKRAAQRRQDEAAAKAAQKREDEAAAKAKRAKDRARKLKGAPPRVEQPRKAPKPEDVPTVVAKSKFMADAQEAKALVRRMDREISPHIDDLSKAFVIGTVEELLEIAEAFRALANKINRNQTNKRAHLHAVAS